MNIMETATALALAQSFDRRTVGEGDIRAWHAIIGEIPADDVMEAIRRHYAEETDWIMPAHVRRIVRDIVRERAVAATKWAPGQYGVPKADALPELPHGERLTEADVSPKVLDLLTQLRASLPDVPRSKLFPREAYWEAQQRAFQGEATLNPHYRPEAAAEALRMSERADPDPAEVERAAKIADCRTSGPHDSGLHVVGCPDAGLPPETFKG